MVQNILKGHKLPKPSFDKKQNDKNGLDAERLSAAVLTMALNSRVSWASRKEDNSKIDLIISMQHPWIINRMEVVLTQVKSGFSYAKTSENPEDNKQKLSIDKSRFKEYLKRNHHTLICWINRATEELFWVIVKANSEYLRSEYNFSHRLTPATRYDIIRIFTTIADKNGGVGLIFHVSNESDSYSRLPYSHENFRKLRKKARKAYKELQSEAIVSPLFGHVHFTRLGWRHITRTSRLNDHKISSYEILPLLRHLIERAPSKHHLQYFIEEEDEYWNYRQAEYLCQYDHVKQKKSGKTVGTFVFVKILESIRYPRNWKSNSQLNQLIDRKVTFKSIYYKQKWK